jgi:hypothetical protein
VKLKCKIDKCGHMIDTAGVDALKVPVLMVEHVKARHLLKHGQAAIMAITPYLSTYFFEPVDKTPDERSVSPEDTYTAARKTLLQGFKEWARTAIK